MVKVLISGGQTGADRAALDVALRHGIPHGGWCPAGRRAEDGPLDARYQLKPTPQANYLQRTEWNVRDSDATVVFTMSRRLTAGSRRTVEFAKQLLKPWVHLSAAEPDADERFRRFLEERNVVRLNVAGSRESTSPGIYAWVAQVLERALFGFAVPAIDRLEAQRIAAEVIAERGMGSGARAALLLEELSSPPPNLYNGPKLADCWIVYAQRPELGIRASTVVLVSRATGAVLYAGSAHDEG